MIHDSYLRGNIPALCAYVPPEFGERELQMGEALPELCVELLLQVRRPHVLHHRSLEKKQDGESDEPIKIVYSG